MLKVKTLLIALCAASAAAFAPQPTGVRSSTSLNAHEPQKFLAAAVLGSAMLLGEVAPALAAFNDNADFGSTQLLAARSGGRVGGRSGSGGASRSAPRVIERQTTVIHSQPAYSSPSPVFIAPAPVYNPMPGLGLGLGLSAINDIGNSMRDYRQETEIQQSKAELQQARMKEAELEARLRQLELQSAAAK